MIQAPRKYWNNSKFLRKSLVLKLFPFVSVRVAFWSNIHVSLSGFILFVFPASAIKKLYYRMNYVTVNYASLFKKGFIINLYFLWEHKWQRGNNNFYWSRVPLLVFERTNCTIELIMFIKRAKKPDLNPYCFYSDTCLMKKH